MPKPQYLPTFLFCTTLYPPPLPARPPKYQNLWVGIFPVENYHSLSYKYRGGLMAHCMIKTCAAAKQL